MIKFFRKIRQQLLTENKFSRYLLYAIGEIVLVVIGILIALQINNWNENRKGRIQELSSMKEVVENLKYDMVRCDNNINKNATVIKGLDSLRTSISNAIDGNDQATDIYYYALKYGIDYNKAVLNRAAYEELINSGSIKAIDNRTLVQQLSDYYQRIAFTVPEFRPKTGYENMQTSRKKFISFKGLEPFLQSFDTINKVSFSVDYDFKDIQQMEHLKLLQPHELALTDYYNDIAQFQIDLKTYIFYMSWVKEAANDLILDIKKEYQLTDTIE